MTHGRLWAFRDRESGVAGGLLLPLKFPGREMPPGFQNQKTCAGFELPVDVLEKDRDVGHFMYHPAGQGKVSLG